ncbi:MAG: elongation factor G [Lentisphaeria bacterium]
MPALNKIRNIGIIAHIDAGKTTATENMLFFSGLTHRVGSIDDGTTFMDYLDEERSRGITIAAAAASFQWQDSLIHLIDTPGHIDFTAEVERSLRVIDGAVVIFSGVEGVEAQSEKVWRQAAHYYVPKMAFINKLDRIGASFDRVFKEINHKFSNCAVAIQLPLGEESELAGVIDLIRMECITFSGDNNEHVHHGSVPAELREKAEQRRAELIERLADFSDEVALRYLADEELCEDDIKPALRQAVLQNDLVPVFVGSAKNKVGVQPLMDGIVSYLPSPADRGSITARRVKNDETVYIEPDQEADFTGLLFKIVASPSADLLYLRTYSGTLKQGSKLVNARTREKIKIKQMLRLFAKSTEPLGEVGPGDIVGLIGPRNCTTGDTLCEPHRLVSFEEITFPEPVVSVAVEPQSSREKDRLKEALELLCREDPTLALEKDEETGQWLFSGMGELHIDINLKRLAAEFNVEPRAGEPRVAYRETLRTGDSIETRFQKMIGDNELEAGVTISFEPLPRGEELFKVTNSLKGKRNVPKQLARAAEQALNQSLRTGGNHGYALIYVKAQLLDLKITPDKTNENAVAAAVLKAVDEVIQKIGTTVLEPVMYSEILSPIETVGEVTSYLQPKRAVIHEMTTVGNTKKIICEVPLAEMFGFGKALPKLTGGRGSFTMEPKGYQPLPSEVATKMFGA